MAKTKFQTGGIFTPTGLDPLTNLATEDQSWEAQGGVLYDTKHTREGLADLSYYTDPI